MITKTIIANLALAKLGAEQIRNLDDPNLKEARHAKLHIDQAIDEALRAAFWSFAVATIELEQDEDATPVEVAPWLAAYPLPSDFLKLKEIRTVGLSKIDKFEMRRANGKRALLCNAAESISFSYIQRISDPGQFDPLFVAAVVTLLASKMARAVTGSDQLESTLRQTYLTEDLPAARTADGHDSQSAENHPLAEMLAGTLVPRRSNFFENFDDC